MSTKGQVIIPKAVRDQLGAAPGTEYAVEVDRGAIRLVPRGAYKSRLPATTIDEVVGCLKYAGAPISMSEMRDAIRQRAAHRFDRSSK
jgi:AbrB family looped-hinge helix DNA binding protein